MPPLPSNLSNLSLLSQAGWPSAAQFLMGLEGRRTSVFSFAGANGACDGGVAGSGHPCDGGACGQPFLDPFNPTPRFDRRAGRTAPPTTGNQIGVAGAKALAEALQAHPTVQLVVLAGMRVCGVCCHQGWASPTTGGPPCMKRPGIMFNENAKKKFIFQHSKFHPRRTTTSSAAYATGFAEPEGNTALCRSFPPQLKCRMPLVCSQRKMAANNEGQRTPFASRSSFWKWTELYGGFFKCVVHETLLA